MGRGAGLLAAGLCLVGMLTGCTAAESAPSAPPPATVVVTASPSAAAPGSAAPTAAATPSAQPSSAQPSSAPATTRVAATRTDPDAPKGQCADSALRLDVRETGGGLGSRQDLIVFRNAGSTPCTLAGAPGVSVVGGGDGSQLGRPAGRSPGASATTTLQPGDAVTAQLDRQFVDGRTTTFRTDDGLKACTPRHGDGYRIYPPHSFRAVFVRHDVWACTSDFVWMHVAPVVAGK